MKANDNAWSLKQCMAVSLLDDSADNLKRLVESHELVKCYGGYDLAKNVMQITPLRKSSYDLIEKPIKPSQTLNPVSEAA